MLCFGLCSLRLAIRRDKIEEKKRRKAEQKQTTTAEPGKDQRRWLLVSEVINMMYLGSAAADGGDDVTSDGLPPGKCPRAHNNHPTALDAVVKGFSIVSLLFVLVGVICVLMAVHHVGIVDLSMIANPLLDLLNMVQGTPLPF